MRDIRIVLRFFFLSLSGCVHSIVICSLCFRNSHRRKRLSGIIFFFYISPLPVLNLLWMVLRCLLARTHHRRCKMVTVIATTLNCFCGCRFFFFFLQIVSCVCTFGAMSVVSAYSLFECCSNTLSTHKLCKAKQNTEKVAMLPPVRSGL